MKSAVVLSFFPAFTPPSSGGEVRLGMFYRALAQSHDITLLTSTDFGARYEEVTHTPHLREFRFPKDDLWRSAYATLNRAGLQGELSGLAFALAVSEASCDLRRRAHSLASGADLVIHDFPFSEPIFADGCPCPEIYNSNNFEASLLSPIVRGDGLEDAVLKLIRLESNLVGRCRQVFAVSHDDAEKFRLFYGIPEAKIGICPNGIDSDELLPIANARKMRGTTVGHRPKLFFLGSAHYPNAEAAEFISKMATELPDCEILLAGSVCNALSNRALPRNVTLLGLIDRSAKNRLWAEVDLFINPVVMGSGTSLKALEALGAAVPMISTPEGVRGLSLKAGIHCEILPRHRFVGAIRTMLQDVERREQMADAGFTLVYKEYSWQRIATNFAVQTVKPDPKPTPVRPLILALNDYSILQPMSGGIARLTGLLTHLDCDVVLISFGVTFDIALITPGFIHVTVPKTRGHQALEDAMNDNQPMSVNDCAASLFAASNQILRELVCKIASRASAVILEHPYMAPLLDAIYAVRPDLPIVYSAHNVETTHKKELLREHRLGNILANFIGELEQRLVAQSRLIVCCTEADAAHFSGGGATTVVVPNGSALPTIEVHSEPRRRADVHPQPRIGFLGSSHGPNLEAAKFIVRELAPAMPSARFELIGSVCTALALPLPKNVTMHGWVDESTKTATMIGWDIALNPLESGGGSSLKLPDYMAHGLPTLNTPSGARGFSVEANGAGRVVERRRFREVLGTMLADPERLLGLQANARRYASEQLNWTAATAVYRQELRKLCKASRIVSKPRNLLVVTYRYTEPPLGGAEEYLIEILKRLRPRFSRLDLAAIDVDQLTNHNHFGCRMSVEKGGGARRLSNLFDRTHFFPPDELSDREILNRARRLEHTWAREERLLLSLFVSELSTHDRLHLFAGFFAPENHNGVLRRWTAPEFSFLAPQQARAFRMTGYAGTAKSLSITMLQIAGNGDEHVLAQYRQPISPNYSVMVSLPKSRNKRPLLIRCEVDQHEVDGDYRPFGVLLESASVLIDDMGALDHAFLGVAPLQERVGDLTEHHAERLRVDQFDRWVSALHDIALQRDAATEADFAAVRGPHSPAMQAWLAAHSHEYDVVLVQGIPFDVVPSSVETLSRIKKRPRVVVLPHFHGDDRFYHWRRFYESFSAADATILFSSSIAERLKSPGRSLVVVPGGGVRADEHGNPMAEDSFRNVHKDSNSYFLVLGRKTTSKSYDRVIRAHQELRRSFPDIDLVLIGPDEDGRKIAEAGVHYLGRQPRQVIQGALRACLAVVNMSASESFGVVLCEAWLFGKPVIVNRACYAFRELVRHNETGILATTQTELIEAMRHLTEQPDERSRMGFAGFKDAITKYTWETVADSCFATLAPEHLPQTGDNLASEARRV